MTDIIAIALVLSISLTLFACFLASFALYYGIRAYIEVSALKQSTHTITYAPVDKEIDEANKLWATQQEQLKTQMKVYQEDIEEEMPEFALDDEDRKVFSF